MKKALPVLALLLIVAAFAAGLIQLFLLRFDTGDVYPEYSSLRSDPLGTMAIYESLDKIPGLNVSRDFSTQDRLPEDKDTTYLQIAADRYEWQWMDKDLAREVDNFVTRGGRLVITFRPEFVDDFWDKLETNDVDEADQPDQKDEIKDKGKMTPVPEKGSMRSNSKKRKKKSMTGEETWTVSMKERWGVEIGLDRLEHGSNDSYEPATVTLKADLPLPETLNWHSGTVFTNLDQRWHTIYARHQNGVVIERKFGMGTLVLASDSYFLSNEALWKDRQPGLLAWLIGPSGQVVFDESHFGIAERSGVATLMRKYRLQGLIGALVILAGLFIWKNSVSLVPPLTDTRGGTFVIGKDTGAGFVNLLRRNIAPKDILKTCFDEWKKTAPQSGPAAKARLAEAQKLVETQSTLSSRDRTPVATYQKIAQILARSSGFRVPGSEPEPSRTNANTTTKPEIV